MRIMHTMKVARTSRPRLSWTLSTLFSFTVIFTLLILSGCGDTSQAATTKPKTSKTVTTSNAAFHGDSTTSTRRDQISSLHSLTGPNAWTWHTNLPAHRLIIFYGNPLTPVMGPIGQYSDDELIAKLNEQAQVYTNLDPSHPVVPALDYVTPIVQPVPMSDNTWTYRMPMDSVDHYVNVANSNHALFFFDMQIGHSTVQHEINYVLPYLERPGVELALDPEFDMPPGGIPDQVFGRMYASEINGAINTLSNLVTTYHLPPKILIIHQFLASMLPDWQNIKLNPNVQIVTSVDGFGSPGEKIDDYRMFDKQQLIQYPGMKLFYKLDTPVMTPQATLALDPSPLMVMYQ